jgi:hypothetical protein
MSIQTISTDFWEVQFPETWVYKDQGIEKTTYFEAPDGTQGVYLSTWRTDDEPLLAAMRSARVIEQRHLPTAGDGEWEVLQSTEQEGELCTEVRSEYLNRAAGYRIVSRLLGRADCYVRLTYHDYGCADLTISNTRSEPWIQSLCLRNGGAE